VIPISGNKYVLLSKESEILFTSFKAIEDF
jgi:hypothetical protein